MALSKKLINGHIHMWLVFEIFEQKQWLINYEVSISFNKNVETFTSTYKIINNTCFIKKTRLKLNFETQSWC